MLELKAHAKINLGLSVTAKRADGFHELDTLFARLDVFDTVRLEPRPTGITLKVEGAELPTGQGNLCYRAAEAYLRAATLDKGLAITLVKRLPIAAGLGGGSSDAAAVLRGAAQLYPSSVDLHQLALALGSDVPFFMLDETAARGRGRGELLEPVALPSLQLVLANPGVHVTAAEAYGQVTGFSAGLNLEALLPQLTSLATGQSPAYVNTLQEAVVARHPDIAAVLTALKTAGLRGVLMSGSGPTCFGLASSQNEAAEVAASLQTLYPEWWLVATRTV